MAASAARKAFDQSAKDIERLVAIHKQIGGKTPGRRYGLEVLNKSAIVLITALWEAYCEDVAAEGLEHLVRHAQSVGVLPEELRKQVAKELKKEDHELAIWKLAGDNWKKVLQARLSTLREERNKRLNTPKTEQIDALFYQALGIERISSRWYWAGMSSAQAARKLDRYVTLRGAIAHRGAGVKSVTKSQVNDYFEHVRKLVSKTGGRVNGVVKGATGKGFL